MSSTIYKRKRLIINPAFQYKLIGLFFVVSLLMSIFILSFSWTTYNSFVKKLTEKETKMSLYTDLVNEYVEKGANVFWVPAEIKKQVLVKLIFFTSFLSLIVFFLGIIISHRIAGPLHRLNSCLLAVSRDEPVPALKFRNKDEFPHLADSFNKCVDHLKSKHDLIQKTQNFFIKDIESLIKNLNDESLKSKILERIDQLKYSLPANAEKNN